jgi:O-antigen chain-terminating methyltransferase
MIEPQIPEINIDEIMRRIKEEVERRKKLSGKETHHEAEQSISKSSPIEENTIKNPFDHFLWKYGRRYKKIIKKVPTLKDIAKKQHLRLAHRLGHSHPVTKQSLPSQLDINVLPYYINYHGFLIQVKEQEGLKGRIKSFLFKFIRFFAWWQEQINRALYQELMAHKARMDERDRWVQELHHEQINSLKKELSVRDKMVGDLHNGLIVLSQAKDELSREMSDQKVKIGETQSHLEELLNHQGDHLKGELAKRDKVLKDLGNRLNLFGQAKDELSQELIDQRAELGEAERRMEGLLNQQGDHLRSELAERDKVLEDLGNRFSLFGQAKDELYQGLSDQKNKIDETRKWMESLFNQQIDGIKGELSERDKVIDSLNNRLVQFGRVEEELNREMTLQKGKLDGMEKEARNLLNQGMDNLKLEFTESYKNLKDTIESTKKELSSLLEVKAAISHMTEEMRDHKLNILDQQRRLTLLLEEAKKRLPKPIGPKQIKNMLKEEDHLLDAMYVAFQDRFRGTREDIKEKLKVYLPYVKQTNIGKRNSPVLDLGCGRGEWLEILKEEGYVAKGIEINRVMLDVCRERGFDVVEADALEYLRSRKTNSFGAISGFHILEHLPLRTLITLLDESYRTLQSGGLIIFESPNPTNILVSAYDFYRDPSHLNHLHPDTINFLAELRGFVKTGSYFIDRTNDKVRLIRSTEWKLNNLNDYLNASRDFVVIGYKE